MTAEPLIKDGQKIVFLGNSITKAPNGYVSVTQAIIGAVLPEMRLKFINAGVDGDRITDILERIGPDVIAHDPDWITVSVGINDVWHGINGTPLEIFTEKYDELVCRLKNQTVANLALFTTTVIGEDLENETNRRLVAYNDVIRRVASRYKCLLVPINEAFQGAIRAWHKSGNCLKFTTDGVHMTASGDHLMALTLLKAWKVL